MRRSYNPFWHGRCSTASVHVEHRTKGPGFLAIVRACPLKPGAHNLCAIQHLNPEEFRRWAESEGLQPPITQIDEHWRTLAWSSGPLPPGYGSGHFHAITFSVSWDGETWLAQADGETGSAATMELAANALLEKVCRCRICGGLKAKRAEQARCVCASPGPG